jgi:hypothetical protein
MSMFKLYTQKQLDEEVERRMWERDRERWIGERMDRLENRVDKIEFQMKHGTDKLEVGEPVPVCGPRSGEVFC